MERGKTEQMTVRISPEALKMVREQADGKHGMGYLVDKAIKSYLTKKKEARYVRRV